METKTLVSITKNLPNNRQQLVLAGTKINHCVTKSSYSLQWASNVGDIFL
jgi:hypothetical protein